MILSTKGGEEYTSLIREGTRRGAKNTLLYTDEAAWYRGIGRDHVAIKHSVSKFVKEQAHTNGMESFRAKTKRGFYGVYHHMSHKHMDRYVCEFEGRHNDGLPTQSTRWLTWCRGWSTRSSPTQN
ncbi:MAG: transposase [Caldilineaceae bacterium SB0675_bin_29]|uniref:Transposase n=1 Tax=Caldilineaceae bacterium SB0675_bin_29 TaxID=2605266 RepID=A0A6B1FXB9_9CHLR|nr:transposase [Caldilineaceae bacterium SB0675_bin_29]